MTDELDLILRRLDAERLRPVPPAPPGCCEQGPTWEAMLERAELDERVVALEDERPARARRRGGKKAAG